MGVTFGIPSTDPPTRCGLATFSQALLTHPFGAGAEFGIVPVDRPQPQKPMVTHKLVTGNPAIALNGSDLTVIQHEYGILGGDPDAHVLRVLETPAVA